MRYSPGLAARSFVTRSRKGVVGDSRPVHVPDASLAASAILARSVFRHGQLRRPAPGSLSATGSLVI
jgi:hypothetical protein